MTKEGLIIDIDNKESLTGLTIAHGGSTIGGGASLTLIGGGIAFKTEKTGEAHLFVDAYGVNFPDGAVQYTAPVKGDTGPHPRLCRSAANADRRSSIREDVSPCDI
jgi:hypothetical protein